MNLTMIENEVYRYFCLCSRTPTREEMVGPDAYHFMTMGSRIFYDKDDINYSCNIFAYPVRFREGHHNGRTLLRMDFHCGNELEEEWGGLATNETVLDSVRRWAKGPVLVTERKGRYSGWMGLVDPGEPVPRPVVPYGRDTEDEKESDEEGRTYHDIYFMTQNDSSHEQTGIVLRRTNIVCHVYG